MEYKDIEKAWKWFEPIFIAQGMCKENRDSLGACFISAMDERGINDIHRKELELLRRLDDFKTSHNDEVKTVEKDGENPEPKKIENSENEDSCVKEENDAIGTKASHATRIVKPTYEKKECTHLPVYPIQNWINIEEARPLGQALVVAYGDDCVSDEKLHLCNYVIFEDRGYTELLKDAFYRIDGFQIFPTHWFPVNVPNTMSPTMMLQPVYLVLQPKNIMQELSINDWNELITSYENDEKAIVEEYDPDLDGYVFITTTLENIVDNHSLKDLRFSVGYRTSKHKTDYKL